MPPENAGAIIHTLNKRFDSLRKSDQYAETTKQLDGLYRVKKPQDLNSVLWILIDDTGCKPIQRDSMETIDGAGAGAGGDGGRDDDGGDDDDDDDEDGDDDHNGDDDDNEGGGGGVCGSAWWWW